MVDAIISTVVEDLISMVLSSIKEEVKLVRGVNNEVKKIVSNFKSIQAVLDDAEEQQVKEASVKNWLFNLKVVSYDMDDVLDEWKTWIQRSQLQHKHYSSNPIPLEDKVLPIFRCICCSTCDVGPRYVVGGKIREIHGRLDDIATDKVRYQLNSTHHTDKRIDRHLTTSFIDTQKVKGRDEEKDQVKRKILEAKSKPHIISLVGMGGIGKTTLAKLIYNDSEIQTHFEKKIWVCVSEPFDEMRIAKAILESLDNSFTQDFREFENVLRRIREIFEKKRILLVLDDVWNESRNKWEELEQSFMCGLLGSTILVTTRNERVAIVMGCSRESIYKVGLLTLEECWSIIKQTALVKGECQNLESIGKKIAGKCKGLPLVAITIGGLLRLKESEKEWLRVLKSEGWDSEDILDPLKLTYYDLPLPLKQCFSYCAIFPKDHMIKKKRLISMWMAQGYLKEKEEDEDLEMIGEAYFKNLIARSLLQIVSFDYTCILHDMVSDLAQAFTKDECLIIEVLNDRESSRNSLHGDARHLTLVIEINASFPVFVYGLNKLRSLIIQFLEFGSLDVVTLESIFDHLIRLRTLDISNCDIEEVPDSINRLIHLRWLDLSHNKNLEKLPETLCECYNLQTLNLTYCCNMVELPQGIGKLINLMYLDIEDCYKINYLPKGIGNLWCLKELSKFYVGVQENEASIVDMEKLNNLGGTLTIRELGNVMKIEEATIAQLKEKKNIKQLILGFEGHHGVEDEEELLEALEPPSDLERLYIENHRGKRLFLSWMMKLNLLRVLKLTNCENCEELPPLGKLPCLEELYLVNMRVNRVGLEFMGTKEEEEENSSFPKLKSLVFFSFKEWEEWDDSWLMKRIKKDNDDDDHKKAVAVFPCLRKLSIHHCPKLKRLPYYLLSPTISKLQRLYIEKCTVLSQQLQKDKLSHITHLFF